MLFGRQDDDHAPQFNLDEMQARIDRPAYALVKQSLSDYDFQSAVDLMATYAGHAPSLTTWMADAEINTDRNLRLQYLAGMWLNSYKGREILSDILKSYKFPTDMFVGSPEKVQSLETQLAGEGRARFAAGGSGNFDVAALQRIIEAARQTPPPAAAPAPTGGR